MRALKTELLAGFALIGLGVLARLLPHPPNFHPIAAFALFAGFFFSRGALSVATPVLSLALGDALLGVYDVRQMVAVYASLVFPLALRTMWRGGLRMWKVAAGSLASSAVFFVVVNFAVWAFSGLYQDTLAGLVQCYAMGLPFLRNSALGDLCWSAALFGGYVLVQRGLARTAPQQA